MGTLEMDKNGICVYINASGAHALGYEPEELQGKDIHETIHYRYTNGTIYPKSEDTLLKALASGEPCLSGPNEVFWSKLGQAIPTGFSGDQ